MISAVSSHLDYDARMTEIKPPTEEYSTTGLAQRRILVVDDNSDSADTLAMLIQMLGAEVRVARDGPAALAQIDSFRPETVLLDISMPGMDGYEVAQRIRSRPGSDAIILIALTGWSQEEDRQRVQASGFNHHLLKPLDIDVLRTLLLRE